MLLLVIKTHFSNFSILTMFYTIKLFFKVLTHNFSLPYLFIEYIILFLFCIYLHMNSDSKETAASNTFSGFLRRTDAKRLNAKRNRATVQSDSTDGNDQHDNNMNSSNTAASTLASLPSDSSVVFDEEATALAASSVS